LDVRDICILFSVGVETKCGKSAKPTTISCSEKPLEKNKSKAATKTSEEQSNLFPVYTRMVKYVTNFKKKKKTIIPFGIYEIQRYVLC